MNELQIFNNEEFGEVRTVVLNSELMFARRWTLKMQQTLLKGLMMTNALD